LKYKTIKIKNNIEFYTILEVWRVKFLKWFFKTDILKSYYVRVHANEKF